MDDELRQAFATLSAQISDVGTDARNAAAVAREAKHETIALSRRFDGVEQDVTQLKHAVFGAGPPPMPMPAKPVVTRITHSEGELAELAGQVIAVKAITEEQSKDLASLRETQETQLSILKRLDSVAANPMVRRIAYAIGVLVLAYLAAKGH